MDNDQLFAVIAGYTYQVHNDESPKDGIPFIINHNTQDDAGILFINNKDKEDCRNNVDILYSKIKDNTISLDKF